jgi:hypothetical protein
MRTEKNEDDYLIRYEISMFMYDPEMVSLRSAAYSEGGELRNLKGDPFSRSRGHAT